MHALRRHSDPSSFAGEIARAKIRHAPEAPAADLVGQGGLESGLAAVTGRRRIHAPRRPETVTPAPAHPMKRESTHAMNPEITGKHPESNGSGPRFATWLKRFVSLLGASALLAPVDKAESAVVLTGINQFGSTANLGYAFANNDIGATYNSATLDLAAIMGFVVDAIVANNPNYTTGSQVYNAMGFDISGTGDAHSGWSSAINSSTGLLSCESQ